MVPRDINELRRLLASGAISEADLSDMAMSGSFGNEPPQNALAQMVNPPQAMLQPAPQPGYDPATMRNDQIPLNTMRNNETGKMTYFNPANSPQPGFSDTPYPPAPQAPQAAPQASQMRVYGTGNGTTRELSAEPARPVPIDYTQAPVDVPGLGKGYRGKDGNVYGKNPDGTPWKAILGYDMAGSMALNAADLKRREGEQQIAQSQAATAHTQEQTAASQQLREAGKTPQAPSGYQWTDPARSGLKPISGGPADFKQQGVFNTDTATLQSSMADLDRLATSANELVQHPGLAGITGIQGAFPNIPGGDAANAKAKLETLKSQVGFGVLQAMRNASKTGGALGNVSDAEGKRLEANLAALSNAQSLDQFQESLGKIVDFAAGAKDRLANAYNMRYGEKGQADRTQALAPPGSPNAPQGGQRFGALPNAKFFKGKFAVGDDGVTYVSDGTQWVKR